MKRDDANAIQFINVSRSSALILSMREISHSWANARAMRLTGYIINILHEAEAKKEKQVSMKRGKLHVACRKKREKKINIFIYECETRV